MRKKLAAVVALTALAAAFAAVAAGGTHSAKQRVRVEVTGTGPNEFVLRPTSQGRVQRDSGPVTFCCWREWYVTRAGARLLITDPRMTLLGKQGTLKIRNQVQCVGLPDDWAIQTGTWKVVGGTGAYAGLSGSGRVASVLLPDGHIRLRLFGFLKSK